MLQQFKTAGGVQVSFEQELVTYKDAIEPLILQLDTQKGALFTSSFEYPGRYTCWDIGFYNPPLALVYTASEIYLEAYNLRGEVMLSIMRDFFKNAQNFRIIAATPQKCTLQINTQTAIFKEEDRSKQPSVFSVIREILWVFKSLEEPYLGLYGAFAYDLIFQFEALTACKERDDDERHMHLFLPDEITIVNHSKEEAFIRRYDFQYKDYSTKNLARDGLKKAYEPKYKPLKDCDHEPGEYAKLVTIAKEYFARGDLFEVVLSQTFYAHCCENLSDLFKRMRANNPAPYGFFINLGEEEYLIGASPEMYVRVQGKRVESCPISGTIKRGKDAIEDAKNIQELLNSEKESSELTMCTDVDRNDKSRICEPGSVRVLGRRQIEMYSRVIHTVDHVEGTLREDFDAVDAFLTHMWVVTVTGAPKIWAMNFIEHYEKSPRRWYGGAVGWFGFDGRLNTGLVLRTMRIKEGIAEIRTGATLLYDSIPSNEEEETRLKASAFVELLTQTSEQNLIPKNQSQSGVGKKILLVDHQDSFVHTLANYLRQTGAQVLTIRSNHAIDLLEKETFDLVVLSPGPGRPVDFNLSETIDAVLLHNIPLFGVCLGLQGIVEYFGGVLDVLAYPMHGKASTIKVLNETGILAGLGSSFTAGRYHSLYARLSNFPSMLQVTAITEDDIVMAITHKTRPIHAVQFHPETILSLPNKVGFKIINNLVASLKS